VGVSATAHDSGGCFWYPRFAGSLRRLSESAQEVAAHAVAIGKTRLSGDDFDRMAALLHHQPSGLDAQVLENSRKTSKPMSDRPE